MAVIRALWTEKSDNELARLITRAWAVEVDVKRVRKLRRALGFVRPSDSVPRPRGRLPGGRKYGPE